MVKQVGAGLIKIEENRFVLIASKSNPGAWHPVWQSGGRVHCSCRGFQYRENCRHSITFLAWRPDEGIEVA